MKRRWTVINTMGAFLGLISFGAPYLNGLSTGEQDIGLWLQMTSVFLGFVLGVLVYSSGLEAEERENKAHKFQDDVFVYYDGCRSYGGQEEEEAINTTAIQFDISPSRARNIVKIYEADDE